MGRLRSLRHGSLFSGIGGFDLAAEWMGWENVFQCEKEEFCQRVLRFYWPKARLYGDIRKFDATVFRGTIDVLSGGFPCQPFSVAGRRKGTADDRYLWPEMCRIIREVRPHWVVGENVPGLLAWSKGMVFEQVLADLEAAGYEAWAVILPAAGVAAPHRRDRVWFVAHAGRQPCDWGKGAASERVDHRENRERSEASNKFGGLCKDETASDTDGDQRCEGRSDPKKFEEAERYAGGFGSRNFGDAWENFPTQPAFCTRNDGIPGGLDGITFSAWRYQSLRGGGNAVVPGVVLQIFRTIERMSRFEK